MSYFIKLLASFGKVIAAILHFSPRCVREWLAWGLTVFWFDILRFRRRIVVENIKNAFSELPMPEVFKMGRRSIFNVVLSVIEFSHFPFFKKGDFETYMEMHGIENVEAAQRQGKGVLLLGLHLGNGDFALSGFASLGYPLHLISKNFKTKWFNDLWFGLRGRLGTKFIPHEKSSFEILRVLKKNGLIIFVLDQFMGPPVGVKVKFFGIETGAAAGLALFAQRTGAPVVPSYSYRDKNGRHHLVFEPEIPFQDHGPSDENISRMTQVYTDKLESIVRLYPDQWLWLHRRWKVFGDGT